jgi:glycine/D-amino acid oxidase-like deaminating enzyme
MRPPRSLWWDTLPDPVEARPGLRGHIEADVAIVGGGYTGLWTARELLERDPSLRVVVVEKSVCGFGASGRNGGWASGLFPVSASTLIDRFGHDAYVHLRTTLWNAVGELGAAAASDGIDAHFHHGGTLTFARSEVQRARLHDEVDSARALGVREDDLVWLDADELTERAVVSSALGATFAPHCARIHPARLVRGLVDAVERRGARIYEETTVTRITEGSATRRARIDAITGSVTADVVVLATEGFTPTIPGHRRDVAPVYSLMIATEPLSEPFWERAGFAGRETFADDRHLVIYGQRTADDRLAFGGRGAPYHFASTVEERFDESPRVFELLEATLRELFDDLDGAVTHRWGGPLGMPRDLTPFVRFNPHRGLAQAGGYTGDGVVLTRVAATALADLITGRESEYTALCFVDRPAKRWEVEPLRWAGINAGLALATYADHSERRRGRESRAGSALDKLMG